MKFSTSRMELQMQNGIRFSRLSLRLFEQLIKNILSLLVRQIGIAIIIYLLCRCTAIRILFILFIFTIHFFLRIRVQIGQILGQFQEFHFPIVRRGCRYIRLHCKELGFSQVLTPIILMEQCRKCKIGSILQSISKRHAMSEYTVASLESICSTVRTPTGCFGMKRFVTI